MNNVLATHRYFQHIAPPALHGGVDAAEMAQLGIDPESVIDFSANQSPLGPAPAVAVAIARAAIEHYPDRDARPLCEAIAAHHHLRPEQVVVGNGSTELIRLIAQLALREGDRALALPQTFGEYAVATELAGGCYERVCLPDPTRIRVDAISEKLAEHYYDLFWLCLPNNPTGAGLTPGELSALVRENERTLFVLDEAYCDLLPTPQWTADLLAAGNIIVLRSMTKAWGLAGLRLGYALGDVSLMTPLLAAKAPWNVNACAQEAGLAALADSAHYARTLALLREQKTMLVDGLQTRGWQVLPSAAAFFLVYIGDGAGIRRQLLAQRCLVRDCASFGLPEHIRISPRLPEQNLRLMKAFERIDPTCNLPITQVISCSSSKP